MLHKRGLSPEDLDSLSPEIHLALMIFDLVIEPNGARHDMIKHANLCNTILVTSQNITKEGRKNAKLSDWDFADLLGDDSLTVSEKMKQREERKQKESQENINSMGAMIKKMAEAKKNGK